LNRLPDPAESAKGGYHIPNNQPLFSKLRDKSLEAFKQWGNELCSHLGLLDDGSISKVEWEESWNKFHQEKDDKL